ncbi:MAG: hypothetical protein SH848_04605, partial [Saprospiraceae bacterium]|nr:hypothetical protein [Saprospiraceae bacterium]MDZ4703184.1 hypothetical protein [Saprospiraceae bacterium]
PLLKSILYLISRQTQQLLQTHLQAHFYFLPKHPTNAKKQKRACKPPHSYIANLHRKSVECKSLFLTFVLT